MADYFPLLTKTFAGLSDTGPTMRAAVYDRARQALSGQLRQLTPPLSEAEIEKEGASLERAIEKMEATYAAKDAPAPAPPPVAPAAVVAAVVPPPAPAAGAAPSLRAERPGTASVTIRKGGRKSSPLWPIALVVVAVPVAIAAWLWRDRSTTTTPEPIVTAPAPTSAAAPTDSKFAERVGGARSPASAPAAPPAQRPAATPSAPAPQSAPAPTASAPPAAPAIAARAPATSPTPTAPAAPAAPEPSVAVAQRAMLFEESTTPQVEPKLTSGRVVWRLDATNPGQGLPLETVIQGRIEVSAVGVSLLMTIRRNVDPALPASHTIELTFATPPGDPSRVVRDVGLPMMRPEETIRGVALSGLPVPVKENVFLIGLSDLKSDVERNTELLANRPWMELPLRFASGQKAVLLFEKGVSGDRVMSDAFKQWASNSP